MTSRPLACVVRIAKRKDEVLKRRQNVKELAAKRRQALLQSQLLQNFKRDTQEVTLNFNGLIYLKMN